MPELEFVTPENFDETRYLLANPDVARHVLAGGNAFAHFRRHGWSERRKQIALAPEEELRRKQARYRRFAPLLDASCGAGGDFRFLEEMDAFPIAYGGAAHSLDQYEAESANEGFGPFILEVRANPDKLYLDIGCGRRSSIEPNCLYLEVYRSASADLVIEPACRYPIAAASIDGIGCFSVLEHVETPWQAAQDFHRMLKPGGKVFIDWPFLQPVHGYPSHYYNATREGLRRMFDHGFAIAEIGTLANQTPDHTVGWILRALVEGIGDQTVRQQLVDMRVGALLAEPPGSPLWRAVLDTLPPHVIETLACGNTLIAEKR